MLRYTCSALHYTFGLTDKWVDNSVPVCTETMQESSCLLSVALASRMDQLCEDK